jgi:DNA-binding MarR family transcriptional regulator
MHSSLQSPMVLLSNTQLQILVAIETLQTACPTQGLPMRQIASEAALSYETVKLHLPRMEANGCLRRSNPPVPTRGRPYRYEVLVDVNSADPSAAVV